MIKRHGLAVVISVVAAFAVVAGVLAGSEGRPARSAPPTATASGPSGRLFLVSHGVLKIIDAGTGRIVRIVHLPFRLGDFGGPMAVSGDGTTLYVDTTESTSCPLQGLLGIDLSTGLGGGAAQTGVSPTVSPDGNELAYLDSDGSDCTESRVVVVDERRTDARRTWQLPRRDELTSLSWSPDGSSLVIGRRDRPPLMLDVDRPASARNPRPLGSDDAGVCLKTPTFLATELVALAQPCPSLFGAGASEQTAVVALSPTTGAVLRTLVAHPPPDLSALLADPGPTRLAGLAGTDLYDLTGGRARLIARHVDTAVWLPAPGHTLPPVQHIFTLADLGLSTPVPGLSAQLTLADTTVPAGTPIQATLTFTNTTTKSISVTDDHGCRPGYAVGLAVGPGPPTTPGFGLSCRFGDPLVLEPGRTSVPETITTDDTGCVPAAGNGDVPLCNAQGRPPPMPPGAYLAKMAGSGDVPLPEPPAVPVTLTAP